MAEALAVIKVEADASGVKAGISDAKSALQSLREAAKDAGESLNSGSEKFLKSLGAQVTAMERRNATFGQGKAGLASYDAAQLGVSGTAATMVARLKASEDAFKAQVAAADGATKSFGKVRNEMGLTAGELSNSLRGVPAQFTDIVVSLASGQRPLTVLLQQGGQLKDMFGGVGNAFKAIGGYVLGLINPLTIAAAAAAALAYAFYKGSQETKAFVEALALTGNYAGTTSAQLQDMARAMSKTSGTQTVASEALTLLAASGKIASTQFQKLAQSAIDFERATGIAIKDSVENYVKLSEEPAKASAKLNETMHYLTQATYERIAALEKQGDKETAAGLATASYSAAQDKAAKEIMANLGYMEKRWNELKQAINETKDALLRVGRPDTNESKALALEERIKTLRDANKLSEKDFPGSRTPESVILGLETEVALLRDKGKIVAAAAAAEGKNAALQQAAIKAGEEINRLDDERMTKAQKMNKELTETKRRFDLIREANPDVAARTPEVLAQLAKEEGLKANIRARYKEDAPKAFRDDAGVKALEKLKEAGALLLAQDDTQGKLLESEKELVRWETLFASLVGKKLTDSQKALLENKAAILDEAEANVASERSLKYRRDLRENMNDLAKQARKYEQDSTAFIISQNAAIAASGRASAEQYDSKLSVIGKGSQAAEQAQSKLAIVREFAKQQDALDADARKNFTTTSDAYKQQTATIAEELGKQLNVNSDYYANLKEKQGDWVSGATQALANYHDKTLDVAKASEQAFTNAFKSMEDAIVEFAKTGKLNIASLVNSILADLLRIQIQKQITGPLSSALGNLFGGAPNQGGINGGAILPDSLRGGQSIGANMARAASVSTGASRAQSVEPMRVTVNNHAGAQVSTNQIGPAELEVIVSAAVGRVDKNIASGTGSTASAMKSRGLNLSGNLPRRA